MRRHSTATFPPTIVPKHRAKDLEDLYPIRYDRRMPWNPSAVQRARERRGITQEQLAARVGVGRVTIARIETGRMRPNVDTAWLIAKALRVKLDTLMK
jgi:DNA-binding XRE family transcriptional regulator